MPFFKLDACQLAVPGFLKSCLCRYVYVYMCVCVCVCVHACARVYVCVCAPPGYKITCSMIWILYDWLNNS